MSIRDARIFKEAVLKNGGFVFDVEHPNGEIYEEGVFSNPKFKIWGCGLAVGDEIWFEQDLNKLSELIQVGFQLDVDSVAYNGKYDYKCLVSAKIIPKNFYPKKFFDPMIAINLLDDSRHYRQLGLKEVVKYLYNHEMMTFEEASKEGLSSKFVNYAVADAKWEQVVWKRVKVKLEEAGLSKLAEKIIFPVSLLFAEMEINGITWDCFKAAELMAKFQEVRFALRKKIVADFGYFNLSSTKQLNKKLFEELGVPTEGIKRNKTGWSTDADTMEFLANDYPACRLIARYRTANKMINTYLLPNTINAMKDEHSRIHPIVWVVSTAGRSRMEKPNFQNQPVFLDPEWFKGLNIRECVVPRKGCDLIIADASQIELRLCAHVSNDKKQLRAYREWRCSSCGKVGESDIILHSCPNCGEAENEDITKKCPTCGRYAVKVDKKHGNCAVCRGEKTHAEALIRGFFHGLDLHQQTADAISVLGGDRNKGKPANFQLVYGATAKSMHSYYPGLSVRQWEKAREEYFNEYKDVRIWHVKSEIEMKSTGVCTSLFGRKRRISKRDISISYKHALNQFINFIPQCSACELMELALTKIRAALLNMGVWNDGVWFNNFVHDETAFDVRHELVEDVKPVIQYHLENAAKFKVPIRSNVKVVRKWSEVK